MTTVVLVRHGLTRLTGPVLAGWTPDLHLDERGEAQAAAVAERLQTVGVTVTQHVAAGPAFTAIIDFADAQDADLIVVGSSTRSRLASRLLGTVPLSLVQSSKRPVLVVTEPTG